MHARKPKERRFLSASGRLQNRYDGLPREIIDRAIWSSSLTSTSMEDTAVMGEIVFE